MPTVSIRTTRAAIVILDKVDFIKIIGQEEELIIQHKDIIIINTYVSSNRAKISSTSSVESLKYMK